MRRVAGLTGGPGRVARSGGSGAAAQCGVRGAAPRLPALRNAHHAGAPLQHLPTVWRRQMATRQMATDGDFRQQRARWRQMATSDDNASGHVR